MRSFGVAAAIALIFAASAVAQETATSSSKKRAVAPDWIRKPSGDDFAANYPPEAMQKGLSGQALIKCEIDQKGDLNGCTVLAERPLNAGFGRASLRLAGLFRASPVFAGGEVTIPIRWVIYPGPASKTVLTTDPIFMAAPSADEIIAAFPKAAIGRAEKGLVRLRCAPRGCAVSSAEPAHMGFEEAALKLSKRFKLESIWLFNFGFDEVSYDVAIQMAPAEDPVWKTRPLGHVEWVQTATPQEAQAAFPGAALKAGLNSGSAIATCTVGQTGALEDCGSDGEDPPGLGFGQAIAGLAERYVMNPWTDEGLPAAGAHVRLPMKLVHDPDPPPAPTPATKP